MNKILIVDDSEINRELLSDILSDEYEVLEAENGLSATDLINREKDEISAILLDLVMPVMDGFRFLEWMNKENLISTIPVLVISGENTVQNEKACFDAGVSDFIARPFNSILVKKRVQNVVSHFVYKNRLEDKVAEQTEVLNKAYRTLKYQAQKLEKRNEDIIDMLGTIVEYRSLESGEHIQRVKNYTRILAEKYAELYSECGLDQKHIDMIVSASSLHDLGKISIPDSILMKPGKLTKDEFEYMKSHTIRGCEILDSMKIEWEPESRQISYDIIRHHHEKYDGGGYPDGLKGDEIPLPAQLVSVADVYDALVNERCYKDAYSTDEAFRMIVNGECGVFSPRLMEVFRNVRDRFEELVKSPV